MSIRDHNVRPRRHRDLPKRVSITRGGLKQRFGFTGGEELLFDGNGNYLGTLRDRLGDRYTEPEEQS